jgi:hypothetical protein
MSLDSLLARRSDSRLKFALSKSSRDCFSSSFINLSECCLSYKLILSVKTVSALSSSVNLNIILRDVWLAQETMEPL